MSNYNNLYHPSSSDPTSSQSVHAHPSSAAIAGPVVAGSIDGTEFDPMNPHQQNHAGSRRQSLMDGSHLQQQNPQPDMRRQSIPMQFTGNPNPMDHSMRRASVIDYVSPQTNIADMSAFHFDPSMNQAIDAAMAGQFADGMQQMQQMPQKQNEPNVPLSVDTQYPNMMDFNALSNSATFQSPFDQDMNTAFLNNMSAMPMNMNMNMMDGDMSVINDMFSAQQFGSPTFASPMAGTFGTPMYPTTQGTSAVNVTEPLSHTSMQTGAPSTDFSALPSATQDANYQNTHQSVTQSSKTTPKQTASTPKTHAKAPSNKARQGQSSSNASIGGLTLPWSEPAEGWPSTMAGAKPHMETQYRDAYAPSGFDLMNTLIRVHTRKNPQISIGMVDLSCAFVVCDAKAHDNPIVYCSDSFERLTGYSKYEITGQNCRFLQSPDGRVETGVKRKYCDDDSVLYLKNCISSATEAQISLINYRKGGQPFMNLLTMIPIMDDNGVLFQFVGFQVDLVENPHAVSARNPDGTYSVAYQRNPSFPPYQLPTPENTAVIEYGHSIPRDEVSTLLATLGTGDNDLSKRMIDKMILENSDDVIHVLSLKGLFLYLSPSCRRILEYDPGELVGTALSSVCHPSDIVPVTRELKEAQSGSSVSVVYRIRRKDTGYVWFESYGCLHTEQGKGRKCIILVGRIRPVYTLSKRIIMTAGGIGDHEMWSKMSTSGMFLYVSNHVKGLLDKHADELVGTNIQDIMRADSQEEFNRCLSIILTGQSATLRHEVINRRGQVLQAHTWLYPGDAREGQKPTFVIGQTRLIKYGRSTGRGTVKAESHSPIGIASAPNSQAASSQGETTPKSLSSSVLNDKYTTTAGVVISRAGALATPLGHQDESLASDENAFEELKTTRSSSWQYELRQLERRNRILAEEVQQLIAAKKKRKRRRGAGMMQKDCANCHTTSTPEWRRGPSGNRDLCNSCGLRWAKQQGRVSPRNTSPRHSMSNGSSKASRASLSPLCTSERQFKHHNHINAAMQGSGNEKSGLIMATSGSAMRPDGSNASSSAPMIHDKRNSPQDPTPDPSILKAQRTHRSSLPSRIEEVEEPAEPR